MRRVLVVDVDVHQGDGTHALLGGRRRGVHALLNGFRNYPFRRVPGDLEVELPDGTGDDRYLAELARVLPQAVARGRPELASCSPAPTRSPATGSAGSRSRRRAAPSATDHPRHARGGGRARVRHARRRLRRGHPRHGRDQPGDVTDVQRVARSSTGASSGIGEATARLLAARLAVRARRAPRGPLCGRSRDEIGGEVEVCDVGDREAVEAMAARVLERHPAIGLLVNNAGMPARGTFLDVDPDSIAARDRGQLPRRRLVHARVPAGPRGAPPAAGARRQRRLGRRARSRSRRPGRTPPRSTRSSRSPARPARSWLRRGSACTRSCPGFVETEGFPQRAVLRSRLLRRFVIEAPDVATAVVGAVEKSRREVTMPWFPYRQISILRRSCQA